MSVQLASQTFGSALQAGVEDPAAMGTQCSFLSAGSEAKLEFTISDANALATALHGTMTDVKKLIKDQETNRPSETIPSLGEWNSYLHASRAINSLTVMYHGMVLYLVADGAPNPDLKAAMVEAMRQTMKKL
jgi:hypothetical protein